MSFLTKPAAPVVILFRTQTENLYYYFFILFNRFSSLLYYMMAAESGFAVAQFNVAYLCELNPVSRSRTQRWSSSIGLQLYIPVTLRSDFCPLMPPGTFSGYCVYCILHEEILQPQYSKSNTRHIWSVFLNFFNFRIFILGKCTNTYL